MGKRANNEGSVYQRNDGRWCAACQVNGRRKYIYGKTQSEVLAKLRDVQAAIANDTYSEPNRMTVGSWLTFWLEEIAPSVCAPRRSTPTASSSKRRSCPRWAT